MSRRRIEVSIVGDSRQLERTFSRASGASRGFGKNLSGLGLSVRSAGLAFAGATAAAGALGAAALRAGARFETTMQQVVGLSGVAQGAVDKLNDEVLALAPTIGKGPQELAEALYFITSSGIPAAKAMDVLNKSARASAAGLGETQTIADAVTSAINAYGPSVVDAARATDVLVATVREGKGEASEFAGVVGNVAAIAAQLGVSFNDVGAALAAQTRLGTDAETAATQLQQVFSNLVKVSPQAEKAFKSVGLSTAGLRKQLGKEGLLSVLKSIRTAFGDNLPAMAKAFGDIRALRGVLALVGKQSGEVEAIFGRMEKASGSLTAAFAAVGDTTTQKFNEMRAAVQVAGIQIGAALAPLAGVVAGALAETVTSLTGFMQKIGEATSFTAKMDVVFTGVREVAGRAQTALGQAVAAIDWDAIWARARGIADGLQARLEEVNFSNVGRTIGDGIAGSVREAIPAVKELASRITDAVSAIDFVKIGKAAGPGLAAALVTAFATLLDPAFWVKNWDLALAVGATAFGGPIGKLAGKLVAPLARLGGTIVTGIGVGILNSGGRLGAAIVRVFEVLPGLAAKALAPLARVVSNVFGRIGRITRFTVKVLGLTAAINAIADLGKRIVSTVTSALSSVLTFVKRWAINVALNIIEPFTHLPLGIGGPAQAAKRVLQGQLNEMVSSSQTAARDMNRAFASVKPPTLTQGAKNAPDNRAGPRGPGAIAATKKALEAVVPDTKPIVAALRKSGAEIAAARNAFFDTALGRRLDAVQDLAGPKAQLAALTAIGGLITAQIGKVRDVTRQLTLRDKLIDVRRQAAGLRDQIAAAFLDTLQLGLARAQVTRGLADDLAALAALEQGVRAQIAASGRTNDLERQLLGIAQQRTQLVQQRRDQAKLARDASQFKALGLGPTGAAKIPNADSLRKTLGSVGEAVKGTLLDTGKTQNMLARIRKVLGDPFTKVSEEVRSTMAAMLKDITGQLEGFKGPLTKTTGLDSKKLIAGLGLNPDQIREIRGRVSGVNSAGLALAGAPSAAGGGGFVGARPIIVESHTTVQLDSHTVGKTVTRSQQKARRRNPPQRRGPNRGD